MKQFPNLPTAGFPADDMLLCHFLLETTFCWVFNDTPKHKPVFDYLMAKGLIAEPDVVYLNPAFCVNATLSDFRGILRRLREENLIEQLYNTCADPLLQSVRHMGKSILQQQSYIRQPPFAASQYSWRFPRSYFNNLLGHPVDYTLPRTYCDTFIHYVVTLATNYGYDVRKHAPTLWAHLGAQHLEDEKSQQTVIAWLDATAALQTMLPFTQGAVPPASG